MTTKYEIQISKFYSRPCFSNFLRGMARTLDIGATMNRNFEFAIKYKTDEEAVRSDWLQVGNDLREAMNKYVETR